MYTYTRLYVAYAYIHACVYIYINVHMAGEGCIGCRVSKRQAPLGGELMMLRILVFLGIQGPYNVPVRKPYLKGFGQMEPNRNCSQNAILIFRDLGGP